MRVSEKTTVCGGGGEERRTANAAVEPSAPQVGEEAGSAGGMERGKASGARTHRGQGRRFFAEGAGNRQAR
ncbi:hypothetical protein CAL28_01630 [Bordetella genomosp. 11]|uniref:Uncharacterized protein n=1 Tax=Bordetella genomosp. 11 TaxID=1416808 RepID=A0A261UXS7_9BORD|nr:hypothetical protein CAL28_01630 [Bordetella genomosp. 11]